MSVLQASVVMIVPDLVPVRMIGLVVLGVPIMVNVVQMVCVFVIQVGLVLTVQLERVKRSATVRGYVAMVRVNVVKVSREIFVRSDIMTLIVLEQLVIVP